MFEIEITDRTTVVATSQGQRKFTVDHVSTRSGVPKGKFVSGRNFGRVTAADNSVRVGVLATAEFTPDKKERGKTY